MINKNKEYNFFKQSKSGNCVKERRWEYWNRQWNSEKNCGNLSTKVPHYLCHMKYTIMVMISVRTGVMTVQKGIFLVMDVSEEWWACDSEIMFWDVEYSFCSIVLCLSESLLRNKGEGRRRRLKEKEAGLKWKNRTELMLCLFQHNQYSSFTVRISWIAAFYLVLLWSSTSIKLFPNVVTLETTKASKERKYNPF